jgi:membrane protease YdiL (CAAX protease family)
MGVASARLEGRRLGLFLTIAFGIAWLTAGVIAMTGGLADSPELLPGVSLATVLVVGPYMFSPAVANLGSRLLTGEGIQRSLLRPRVRRTWRSYVIAWLLPVGLVLVGAVLYFLAFPVAFGGVGAVQSTLDRAGTTVGTPVSISPEAYLAVQAVQLLAIAPLLNSLFTLGEEIGWRGYLLPKLLPLGERRALLVHGIIWGVWHWPIIAMGHNYGLDYPGAPVPGLLLMVLFTVAVGVFLGWLTFRSGAVWPAVLGHAMINGAAGVGLLFHLGSPRLLFGPTASGLLGMVPWLVLAAWLLARPTTLDPTDAVDWP